MDGPVAICSKHGEYSLHTGCFECQSHNFDVVTEQPSYNINVVGAAFSKANGDPQPLRDPHKNDVYGIFCDKKPTMLVTGEGRPLSKATTSNPKDLFGSVKVSLSKLPAAGTIHGGHAMMDGAIKYGPYNWRDKKVIASIYVDAAKRHLDSWFEGEEEAEDSEVHHLGHAIACMSIILDAQETGNLIDDRPNGGGIASKILARLSAKIKARKEKTNA